MSDPTKLTDWRDACRDKFGEVCEAAGLKIIDGLLVMGSKSFAYWKEHPTHPDPPPHAVIAALAHGVEVVMCMEYVVCVYMNRGKLGGDWVVEWSRRGKMELYQVAGNTLPGAWLAAAQRAWGEAGDG